MCATPKPANFRSAISPPFAEWKVGVEHLVSELQSDAQPDIAVIFVPLQYAADLDELCGEMARGLSSKLTVGCVAAGVAGDGLEVEGQPSISALVGKLPDGTTMTPFTVSRESADQDVLRAARSGGDASEAGRPGFLAFADPFSPIPVALAALDAAHPASVVAGGLSCPVSQEQPSLWLQVPGAGGRALPPGSLVGVALRGEHFEMHSLCAQGAAPVGPSFTVTKGQGNVVEELDGRPALEQLSRIAQKSDERELKLIQRALLVGIPPLAEGDDEEEVDYLVRGVLGQTPNGGLAVGDEVLPGRTKLRFHVRDGQAADEDLRLQLGRYKLARNFAGRFGADPRPAAAVLFSCNGRGEGMYGEAGHDSKVLRESLGADVPIAGFFCNGEIGAVGARGLAPVADDAEAVRSLIHGFTSVVALLYDTSEAS